MFCFLLLSMMAGVGFAVNCGMLEARPTEVAVDSEAWLYFTYITGIRTYRLQHKPVGASNYGIVDRNVYEVTTSSTRPLAVFKIHRSQYTDSGTYVVYCSDGTYSTETELKIKSFPPSSPVFGNTVDLYGCLQCLPAWAGKTLVVTCSTWNGTQPVAMEIRKNNIKIPAMSTSRSVGEMKGLVSFVPGVKDNGVELVCLVKNSAADHALITTTTIYIQRLPGSPVIGTRRYREGKPSNVTCSSNGGRPPPSLHFIHNNLSYYLATTILPIGDAFFVETTKTLTFFRIDNGKNITCCSKVSRDSAPQCSNSKLKISFPPMTAKLEKIHEIAKVSELTRLVLRCTVGESFPSSSMEWGGLENIPHNISDAYSKQGKYGSIEKAEAVNMLLSPTNNGREITCTASNKKFPEARPTTTYTLNVTYAPIITILPQGNITLHVGDDVSITCDVDGNPASSIGWYNEMGLIREIHAGLTKTNSLELDLHDLTFNSSATFTCKADNGIGSMRGKSITITVTDKSFDKLAGSMGDSGSSGMTAVVVCLLLLVVIVTIVVVVVFFRRRRKHEVKLESDILQIRVEERQPSINPPLDEPVYNNINRMGQVEDGQGEEKCEIHRDEQANKDAQSELVYAELELSDDGIKPQQSIRQPSETEYVSIDFTKKVHNNSEANKNELD